MTDITWGEEIAVNGARPPWLRDGDLIDCKTERGWVFGRHGWLMSAGSLVWSHADDTPNITHIRLPADHWAYEPLRRGFTPWAGGDCAPEDWDKGPVLYRSGAIQGEGEAKHWLATNWRHLGGDWDIIGYKPRPAAATEEVPEWALERVSEVVGLGAYYSDTARQKFARYIMQHEEQPVTVDPDVEAVREILDVWYDGMIAVEDGPHFQAALAVYRKWKDRGHE